MNEKSENQLVNLTPHPIVLRTSDGENVVIPASGTVARVEATPGLLVEFEGIPVPVATPTLYGEITGLPEPEPGVFYIVSGRVLSACPHRKDVVGPGTGPADGAIREPELLDDGSPNPKKGQIIAVTRLIAAG